MRCRAMGSWGGERTSGKLHRQFPWGPGGYPLPMSSMTPEQKQALMRASPRINPNRIFVPGTYYDPQVRFFRTALPPNSCDWGCPDRLCTSQDRCSASSLSCASLWHMTHTMRSSVHSSRYSGQWLLLPHAQQHSGFLVVFVVSRKDRRPSFSNFRQ